MTARLRALGFVVAGSVVLFAGAYGLLDVGLKAPSAAERVAVRILAKLQRTRGVRAVLTIDGRSVRSTCHGYLGRDFVRFDDGTGVTIVGVHAFRTVEQVSDRRRLYAHRPAGGRLVAVEAAIAGSHAFWARILAVRLEQADVHLHATEFGRESTYEVLLSHRPMLDLIVDRATLDPIATVYRSGSIDATSRLLATRHAIHGC